jgi:hypothetical protein
MRPKTHDIGEGTGPTLGAGTRAVNTSPVGRSRRPSRANIAGTPSTAPPGRGCALPAASGAGAVRVAPSPGEPPAGDSQSARAG